MIISKINLTDYKANFNRLDAEFYQPSYLEIDNMLSAIGCFPLNQISNKIDVGFVGRMTKHYCNTGVPLIQTQNIDEFFVKLENPIYIDLEFHVFLKKSQISKGDLLIARSGSFGKACVYYGDDIINSSDIIIVKVNDNKYNTNFLSAFLNSKYGSNQLNRFASGGLQGHVNLTILGFLKVPEIDNVQQIRISTIIENAYSLKIKSQSLYYKASKLLENELNLDNIQSLTHTKYTTTFHDIVWGGRFDSDYFRPFYVNLKTQIRNYKNNYEFLLTNIKSIKPNIDPNKFPNSDFKYIELSDINSSLGTIISNKSVTGLLAPSRAKRLVSNGDILASSVVGSIDKSAIVSEKEDGFLASTGFFQFRSSYYSPEYLLLLVRSKLVREQLMQESTGGILSAVPDINLNNIIIPKIPLALQDEITRLVSESHIANRESLRLLDQAKTEVETIIELAAAAL
jgi:restriction endonuclease S subunit